MRSYKTSLSLGKGKSPLSRHDHSVSVCSSVHGTPDIRSLLFISQMPLMEKSSAFFSDKNSNKTSLSSERNPTTVAEIIIKTVQQKYYYETARRERRTVLTVKGSQVRLCDDWQNTNSNWTIDALITT